MPTSNPLQISTITHILMRIRPVRLLDFGVGFGKYGVLAREYLDIYNTMHFGKWQTTIDGIEVCKKYLSPLHDYIYNQIFVGEGLEILTSMNPKSYDLIMMIDVLEHFPKDQGKRLIEECKRVGSNTLIAVPQHADFRGTLFGNAYEHHLSQWTRKDFRNSGVSLVFSTYGATIAIFSSEKLNSHFRFYRARQIIKSLSISYGLIRLIRKLRK